MAAGCSVAWCADRAPLPALNLSPLWHVAGVPSPTAARVAPKDATDAQLLLTMANHWVVDMAGTEQLVLDGELWQMRARLAHGLGGGWEMSIEIPVMSWQPGVLDGLIEGWHDTFGLPDGGRPLRARNLLEIRYRDASGERIAVTSATTTIGDLALGLGRELVVIPEIATTVRVACTLPTGDPDRLAGSGGPGLSLWLSAAGDSLLGSPLGWLSGLGLRWNSDGTLLAERRRALQTFGTMGFTWGATDELTLKAQLDAASAPWHDTHLRAMGQWSLLGSLGLSWLIDAGTGSILDLAVGEDLAVHTAPDVTLTVQIRRRF